MVTGKEQREEGVTVPVLFQGHGPSDVIAFTFPQHPLLKEPPFPSSTRAGAHAFDTQAKICGDAYRSGTGDQT